MSIYQNRQRYDPEDLDEEWEYVFTRKGQQLVDHWTDRLYRIGAVLFPNVEIEIHNWHYEEY